MNAEFLPFKHCFFHPYRRPVDHPTDNYQHIHLQLYTFPHRAEIALNESHIDTPSLFCTLNKANKINWVRKVELGRIQLLLSQV
jgi:hypothetical protein